MKQERGMRSTADFAVQERAFLDYIDLAPGIDEMEQGQPP